MVRKSTLIFCLFTLFSVQAQKANLNSDLLHYCSSLSSEFNQIPSDRKEYLNELVSYIAEQQKAQQEAKDAILAEMKAMQESKAALQAKADAEKAKNEM